MTDDEFNEKYKNYLEVDHYGLDIGLPQVADFLDKKFQRYILLPNFSYSQIKVKFATARFYCDGLKNSEVRRIEQCIEEIWGYK